MIGEFSVLTLNHLLAQARWARQLLQAHAGRKARIDVGQTPLAFSITEQGTFLPLAAGGDHSFDVVIRIPLATSILLQEGLAGLMREARIEGQVELAETLATVLKNLPVDPAAELAPLVGDIAAQRIQQGLGALLALGKNVSQRLHDNVLEYTVYEQALVIQRSESDLYAQELTEARDQLARLEKRVGQLQA